MGIDTEILGGLLVAAILCLLKLNGINLLMAVPQVEGFLAFRRRQVAGVFELVPSPVGHGVQRHTCLIIKRERLQAGNVDRRCKVSVTHRQRGQRVGLADDWVITVHDGLPVDGSRRVLCIIA